MQTVILKGMSSLITGVVDYSFLGDCIRVNYSICANSKENLPICKIVLLSSHRPFNRPVIADTLEFIKGTATGEVHINQNTLSYNGYNINDMDTFCVIEKDGKRIKPIAVGYQNLLWNIQTSLDNMTKEDKTAPLARGELLLQSIKKKPRDENSYRKLIEEIESFAKALNRSTYIPVQDYEWYDLAEIKAPLGISAYCHILYVPEVADAFEKEGTLLFGIKNGGKSALAIKCRGENPFVNVWDCAARCGEFWVVGIEFKEDGQYFSRIKGGC